MGSYYIIGGEDSHWMKTKAQTIKGAKTIASKTYKTSATGKIKIGEDTGYCIQCVAVKYGYDNWVSAS
jgi:hypothetical protein